MKKSATFLFVFLVVCACMTFNISASYFISDNPNIGIDGIHLRLNDTPAIYTDGVIFIPAKEVLENIGCTVSWDDEDNELWIFYTGQVYRMSVGSAQADANGTPIELDAAPFLSGHTPYVPFISVGEMLGQKVEKLQGSDIINMGPRNDLTKDIGWFINCMNSNSIVRGKNKFDVPGGNPRNKAQVKGAKEALQSSWNVTDRQSALDIISWLYEEGHQALYYEFLEIAQELTDEDVKFLVKRGVLDEDDINVLNTAMDIYERWGDTGIMAWDLGRVSQVAGWAYISGYITYEEYILLCTPAAIAVQERFSGWEDFDLNYVYGSSIWLRNGMENPNPMLQQRIDAHDRFLSLIESQCAPWDTVLLPLAAE